MRRILLGLVCACVCLAGMNLSRAQEAGETGGARVGAGKAVVKADEKQGLRLSDAAVRRLGLSFQDMKSTGIHPVPLQSLVHFGDEIGVYRLRGGWFKLVEVRLVGHSPQEARIQSSELKPGDRIVVRGAPFLRATELDVFGAEEKGDERRD